VCPGCCQVVVRCEEIAASGGLVRQKMEYLRFLRKRMNTKPDKGPYHFPLALTHPVAYHQRVSRNPFPPLGPLSLPSWLVLPACKQGATGTVTELVGARVSPVASCVAWVEWYCLQSLPWLWGLALSSAVLAPPLPVVADIQDGSVQDEEGSRCHGEAKRVQRASPPPWARLRGWSFPTPSR